MGARRIYCLGMPVNEVEGVFETYGLLAVCLVMFVKAAGIAVPVPGDLIVLGAAAQASQGKLMMWQAFLGLLIAVVGGGVVQFAVARGPGRGLVYRVARFAGLSGPRLDLAADAIQRRGPLSLVLALLTPGLRNAAVPACGLAGMSARAFVPPLVLASGLDLALHFVLGAFGGSLLYVLRPDPMLVLLGFVILAGLGLAAWLILLRQRRSRTPTAEVLAAWEATACPVCIAFAFASRAGRSRFSCLRRGAHGDL